jgi:putative transposase
MPFIKIYIHIVWSTKNRVPYLYSKSIRSQVWQHIKENAKTKKIYLESINGYADHCHCLISLSSDQNIEKVVQLLKGESSYWINKTGILNEKFKQTKFAWQSEYFAVSISETAIPNVSSYIANQEAHHTNTSFETEYTKFITHFNFENNK